MVRSSPTSVTIDREYIADYIFKQTYAVSEGPTTVKHSAKSWSRKALEDLVPPFPGAPVSFVLFTAKNKSGHRTTLWNPIPGMSAIDAWDEYGFAISKLAAVVFSRVPR